MFARERLLQLCEALVGRRVAVYCDLVADRFIYGTPKRISREAPVLILRQYRDDILPGGGGNAVNNIASLGGVPVPVAVAGNDAVAAAVIAQLEERGVNCDRILRVDRYQTPTKVRVLGGMPHSARQQIVRYDIEDVVDLSDEERDTVARFLEEAFESCDGALISDYGYGAVRPELAVHLTGYSTIKPVTVDSRYQLLRFADVTAATPNEDEASSAAGIPLYGGNEEENLREVGDTIRSAIDAEALLVTRGSRGMAVFEKGVTEPFLIPVHGTDQIADVTGAGDTVIATFTLALCAGGSFLEAAKLANYAGGIVVMKMGTATVSNEELRYAIERDEALQAEP
jgi:D-glycero-beta-D-manno-heptose-7-phosphate kinase